VRLKIAISSVMAIGVSFSANADALNWANGYWGLDQRDLDADYKERNCSESPVEIRIDVINKSYWSQIGDDEPRTGVIIQNESQSFTIKYDNETRLMNDGQPHIWTINFIDENTFYWVREDWKALGPRHKTANRYRCLMEMS